MAERFDLDRLDEDPFEVDAQAAHLFKHPHLGLHDVYDVWVSDPLFYPAKPPAHWLMCGEVAGKVLVVPLALPAMATRAVADRSDVMRPLRASLSNTGGTDERRQHDDAG